jgi:hypothetical protein
LLDRIRPKLRHFRIIAAIARKKLATAFGTALHIAADNVKLSLYHRAIVTRLSISAPVLGLVPVPDSSKFHTAHNTTRLGLRRFNFLRPAFDNAHPVVHYEFVSHVRYAV